MDTLSKDFLNEIFQLFKKEGINLISNYKDEIARHLIGKIERIKLLESLKDQISEEFYNNKLIEEKDFSELFKNKIKIIALAKSDKILLEIGKILDKIFVKLIN